MIKTVKVIFDEPIRAITPGQAVVFYDGDVCLVEVQLMKYFIVVRTLRLFRITREASAD